ncbi:MAG: peptide-methionine (S)-S-oxide reductase [Anaerovibrio sp.]|uniref:peptide-methionine (S)-S-oxide reductase n=1 Tax=Anaerovibrio sp. TaxID=1872532 RepID=UPI0025D3C23B|nr:peptide-methionine (S)-S-oxide reductase [Anaerovibrio sp.]MCR5175382.1 peptide-methionine (S)-S-oxide reductase [Anaerovibrio sp.]
MYTKKIYLSGGNFHELQAVYEALHGVIKVCTGYINPDRQPADYESVAAGRTNAVMGICLEYNPKKIDISMLLDVLFAVTDPYSENQQGPLKGPMYGCGVYYVSSEDLPQLQLHINFMANRGTPPAVDSCGLIINDPVSDQRQRRRLFVKVERLESFTEAEEVHQNFLLKNPDTATYIDICKFKRYIGE